MTLIDALGTVHAPVDPAAPLRIVSLVPSITELLCDLGLADVLVGRTGFCIHPAATVARIAKVGGTKDINVGKILALAPTHLIVNIDENPKPAVDLLARTIAQVIVTHPLAPFDNLALYRLLGGVFRREAQAEALCAAFEQAASRCRSGAAGGAAGGAANGAASGAASRTAQRVMYCIWQDPWMTVSRDTYIARMLAHINWQQWQPDLLGARYPVFEWREEMVRELDRVLLSSEPYNFTQAHADQLAQQLGIPVQLVDGEMLSWYGSRAITAMDYLDRLGSTTAQR